jgi:hypothetical protein
LLPFLPPPRFFLPIVSFVGPPGTLHTSVRHLMPSPPHHHLLMMRPPHDVALPPRRHYETKMSRSLLIQTRILRIGPRSGSNRAVLADAIVRIPPHLGAYRAQHPIEY